MRPLWLAHVACKTQHSLPPPLSVPVHSLPGHIFLHSTYLHGTSVHSPSTYLLTVFVYCLPPLASSLIPILHVRMLRLK